MKLPLDNCFIFQHGKHSYPVNCINKSWPGPHFGAFVIYYMENGKESCIFKGYGELPVAILKIINENGNPIFDYYVACIKADNIEHSFEIYKNMVVNIE